MTPYNIYSHKYKKNAYRKSLNEHVSHFQQSDQVMYKKVCVCKAYQVSKNVLQYVQLQKKEIPPFWLLCIVCTCKNQQH